MGLRDRLRPKPKPDPLARLSKTIEDLACAVTHLSRELNQSDCHAVERHECIMATLQDLRDALTEQNAAILAEVEQINAALAAAGNVPQDVVDNVKAHTATIKGIIADPLPVPDPVPPVPPERRR